MIDSHFLKITYGSRLFGTSTPESDTDNKVIFIPSIDSLLLGQRPKVTKTKFDSVGNHVPEAEKMPANGVETEFIPIQTFVSDFVAGQTYAVEIAFGYLTMPLRSSAARVFIEEMVEKFTNSDVLSMVSFADKQTFDYVRRGERLNNAKRTLSAIDSIIGTDPSGNIRLDTRLKSGEHTGKIVLDVLAALTGLPIGSSNSGTKTMRTLEMNSRQYLESTSLSHIRVLVVKQVQAYGDRSKEAAEKDVDWKSLSHAVRVYQQVIELLNTGKIVFPRPNAKTLLSIKQGEVSLDVVRQVLIELENSVQELVKTSTLQPRTPELEEEAQRWLLAQLHKIYGLA